MDYRNYDVLCIGIPKSGTNATVLACSLLGVKPSPHMHTANYLLAGKHKVAYVYRNPRNVLISAQRYQNHQMRGWEDTITEEKLIDQFFDFFNASMPAVYRAYEKWFNTKAFCFKYEHLFQVSPENQATFDSLADYLGKPRKKWVRDQIISKTPTWTGKQSNWQDHWSEGLERIWRDEGMIEIEKSLGY